MQYRKRMITLKDPARFFFESQGHTLSILQKKNRITPPLSHTYVILRVRKGDNEENYCRHKPVRRLAS